MSDTPLTTTDPAPWYAGLDPEILGAAQNRGWDKKTAPEAFAEAVKAHREAVSKLTIPADRVLRIPDAADADGWKAVRQKLGVPASPEEYDFSAVKQADGTPLDEPFTVFVRETAAQLNLTKDAAPRLAEAIIKQASAGASDRQTAAAAALAVAQDQLAQNWGPNATTNKFIADRAATLLGLTPELIGALPVSVYPAFMDKLREVGTRMGEATLLGLGDGQGGARVATREGAIARIEELKHDKAWYARWKAREPSVMKEWDDLNNLAARRA